MIAQAKSTGGRSRARRVRQIVSRVPESLRLELAKLILLEEAEARYDSSYFSLNGGLDGWVIAVVKRSDPLPLLRNIIEEIGDQRNNTGAASGVVLSERREETLRLLLFGRSEK